MRDFRKVSDAYYEAKYPGNGPHLITGDEDENAPHPQDGDIWGRWQYDAKNKCIEHTKRRDYWIALDRLDSCAKLGNWCLHMSGKKWITRTDLGNLVYAVHDICGLTR
jgi:hypothetical protein